MRLPGPGRGVGMAAAPSLQVCPSTSGPCPSQEFVWQASHYLVRQVFNSLQEMFSSTRAIQVCPPPLPSVTSQIGPHTEPVPIPQRWLTESARLIARSGLAVEWVTPLGIPIIQPYHHDSKVSVCMAPTSMATPTAPQLPGQASCPILLPSQPYRSAEGSRVSPSAAVGTPTSECRGGGGWTKRQLGEDRGGC